MKKNIIILSVMLIISLSFSSMVFAVPFNSNETNIEKGNQLLQDFIKNGRNVTVAEFLQTVHPEFYASMEQRDRDIAKNTLMWTKELFEKEFPEITLEFKNTQTETEITPMLVGMSYFRSSISHLGAGLINYSTTGIAGNLYLQAPRLMTCISILYQVDGNDLLIRDSSPEVSTQYSYTIVASGTWGTDWPGDFQTVGHLMVDWGLGFTLGYGTHSSNIIYVSPY